MLSELEARLLASIRNAEDFEQLQRLGIGEKDFPDWQPVYRYIKKILEEHGAVPRLRDLKDTFNLPASVVRDSKEFPFLIKDFRRMTVARQLQGMLDEKVEKFGEDPEALIDELQVGLATLQQTDKAQMSVTDRTMGQRMDIYAQKARLLKSGQPMGIPTGISFFDDKVRIGWLPGELVGVVGRTYVGKSWLLMFFGIMAWQSGQRVLFISPEMSVEETEARFDALMFAKNDSAMETSSLYRGHVPNEQHRELARGVSQHERWYTYASTEEGGFNLAHVSSLAKKWRSQVIVIDGLPLLESGGRQKQMWETIKDLSYGLKRLAVSLNTTILVSHQATRSAHNVGRPPGLHEIAYGDAFSQACDRILALSKPASKDHQNVLRLTIQKFRKGQTLPGGVDFHFAPEKGEIHELLPGDSSGSGADGDALPAGEGAGGEVSLP